MIELFEVCGTDPQLVFSPFCWRVRLALALKGLPIELRAVTYSDKAQIAFSGQPLLPIIRDGESTLHDSHSIISYLDQQYPQTPLGLGGQENYRARLIDRIAHQDLLCGLFRLLVLRILPLLSSEDRSYFRNKQESQLGTSLEEFADVALGLEMVERALQPLEAQLTQTPYLEGHAPGGIDVLIGGFFFWAWVLRLSPWENHPGVSAWFQKLVVQYESVQGPIRRAPQSPDQLTREAL